MEDKILLEVKDVVKSFGSNRVLKHMNFQLRSGEVHALLGINGAGKSTLIKIISGAYRPDSGKVYFENSEVDNMTPTKAIELGIATIYQETSLYPKLSVIENLFVGRRIKKGKVLDWHTMEVKASEVFQRLGITIDLYEKIENLGKANAQLVEIARSLTAKAKVLIMDEPTASLSKDETNRLFEIIKKLRSEGTGIIYISHRMEEIFEIADRMTILRDGVEVGTKLVHLAEVSWITRAMLGKDTDLDLKFGGHGKEEVLLEVKSLSSGSKLTDISFKIHAGEIVGLAGLVGSGRTETARAIIGLDDYDQGEITFKGKRLRKKSLFYSIQQGLGYVPEDRGRQGLILEMEAKVNMVMAALPRLCNSLGIRNKAKESIEVEKLSTSLLLNPNNPKLKASSFSGGNQQKIVLGKWLATNPDVLILDEPTCGVDVGSKFEIYKLIDKLASEGKGILVISSDLTDIEILSDVLYVMRNGQIVAEVSRGETKDKILSYEIGGEGNHA